MNNNLKITTNPDIQFGKPVIAGTRVTVETVVGNVAAGMSIKEVMEEYNLTREQVLDALKYASKVVSQEAAVIK